MPPPPTACSAAWRAGCSDRDLGTHLRQRRRALVRDLEALLALVPEPALAGRQEERP